MTLMSLANVLLVNYYIFVIGLEPLVATSALAIGLTLLSVFSLYFGNRSDNLIGKIAQKYGKRRPFILLGMLGAVISFILVWFPPVKPTTFGEINWDTTLWFWIFSAIFHVSLAALTTTYWALLPEISRTNDERMRISIVQNLLNLVATIISIVVPIIFFSTAGPNPTLWYNLGAGSAGMGIIIQMISYSIIFGIFAIITVLITYRFVKEPALRVNTVQKKGLSEFIKELFDPLHRRDFKLFMIATFLINITMRILFMDILVFVLYVLKLVEYEWYIFAGIVAGCGVLSFLGWDKISKKLGLKKAFEWVLAIAAIILFSALIFLLTLPPGIILPAGITLTSIGVAALVGMMVFLIPILAALIDKHKITVPPEEGEKLAGKYNGINSFVTNISQAFANLLYGGIMAIFGATNPVAIVIMLPAAGIFIAAGYFTFKKVEVK